MVPLLIRTIEKIEIAFLSWRALDRVFRKFSWIISTLKLIELMQSAEWSQNSPKEALTSHRELKSTMSHQRLIGDEANLNQAYEAHRLKVETGINKT